MTHGPFEPTNSVPVVCADVFSPFAVKDGRFELSWTVRFPFTANEALCCNVIAGSAATVPLEFTPNGPVDERVGSRICVNFPLESIEKEPDATINFGALIVLRFGFVPTINASPIDASAGNAKEPKF